MKIKKEGLAQSLKQMASAHMGNEFTGLRNGKDGMEFFIAGDNVISILHIGGKSDLPEGMVDSEALQAAIAQTKGEYVNIDAEETDVSTLVIGAASLAMRDAPEIDALDLKLTALPAAVAELLADRLPDTFIVVPPKTVFGWELQVSKGVARYGSTNGALALYEECDIDCEDYRLTIPHETALRICKLVPTATGLAKNDRLLAVQNGAVTHYAPIMQDSAKIDLGAIQKLIDNPDAVYCTGAQRAGEVLQQLLSFADKDSQLLFTIDNGRMQARVSSKVGSNVADVARFAMKEKVNFSCTLRQVMLLAKYDSDNLRLGVGFRDKTPFVLLADFDGSKKRKGRTHKFTHYYLASTTGR